MEKQKRWQLWLIIAVVLLTVYNILPTVLYYSKPLSEPVSAAQAEKTAAAVVERVNAQESDAEAWLRSFSKNLGLKPTEVKVRPDDRRLIEVTFKDGQEAAAFKKFLPKAGRLIPFVPAQLSLAPGLDSQDSNTVLVRRELGIHLDPASAEQIFTFSEKFDEQGKPTVMFRQIVEDRAGQVLEALAGSSLPSRMAQVILSRSNGGEELVVQLASNIVEMESTFGSSSPLVQRYFGSFSQSDVKDPEALVLQLAARFEVQAQEFALQRDALETKQGELAAEGHFLSEQQEQQLQRLEKQAATLEQAAAIMRQQMKLFQAGMPPLHADDFSKDLSASSDFENYQNVSLGSRNPYIAALAIDWEAEQLELLLHEDVQKYMESEGRSEEAAMLRDQATRLVFNEIARLGQITDETIKPSNAGFELSLNDLPNSQSFLVMDLGGVAGLEMDRIKEKLSAAWNPQHGELQADVFPVMTFEEFSKLPADQQQLGLVIYAPSREEESPDAGFRTNSIYVIARGLDKVAGKYRDNPESTEALLLAADMENLRTLLSQDGFLMHPGYGFGTGQYDRDLVFILDDYYSTLLRASREDFTVKGTQRYGVLEFSDLKQRIYAENRIGDQQHEELIKWKNEYEKAQVDLDRLKRFDVPPPTRSILWDNFLLSTEKYFRGDTRKILNWGLDLSGGKTVLLGLRDDEGKVVSDPNDLNQAVNELYQRVNKMGVSEVSPRLVGNNIVLDFPGSQGVSAADLVKASVMTFHILNEQFSRNNPDLAAATQEFLQGVWNEGVVTNRKDIESLNEIAWQHLGGQTLETGAPVPRSEAAKTLYENGLRLANPMDKTVSSAFNDSISSLGRLKGDSYAEWQGQSHPLMLLFHNYALKGADLDGVRVGYDPSAGNYLSFDVSGTYSSGENRAGSPRDDFSRWTTPFSQDGVAGTARADYSNGRGWRMATVLNGEVIATAAINDALRDSARVTGGFSQKEVNEMAADLKAGSLTFTPVILSEENISPELGMKERTRGILAAVVGLALVGVMMIGYYRFAGVIAFLAVLFNLLIMWGVLQNFDVTLSLAGIAGVILTMGMAVDANVLVFERIREEFRQSGRLASAIHAGYKKAFSAILDSNVTTVIAALILMNFDSGPIKGFAVTLIIGIASSMFTALFMTRYFFIGWVQRTKAKELSMAKFFEAPKYKFLSKAKLVATVSVVLVVLGSAFLATEGKSILGMDFTGGYALNVEIQDQGDINYRQAVTQAFEGQGLSAADVDVRQLSRANALRLQFSTNLQQPGKPFYGMPTELTEGNFTYAYEKNPQISWVVDTLDNAGLPVKAEDLPVLEKGWNVMSGQLSDNMRNNALLSLGLAMLCIMVYITFRFEFKYAISAALALLHDILVTVSLLGVLYAIGFPVQIDLQTIAAVMTIIGYSLNDTIIVFDRIREDSRLYRKWSFADVIDHSLNVTLNRTLMTSGTTLIVLLALVVLGGPSIFNFSLVMTIGVLVGTFSSLFIASPIMLYFHNREERRHEAHMKLKKA